jgi:hypothetical protein
MVAIHTAKISKIFAKHYSAVETWLANHADNNARFDLGIKRFVWLVCCIAGIAFSGCINSVVVSGGNGTNAMPSTVVNSTHGSSAGLAGAGSSLALKGEEHQAASNFWRWLLLGVGGLLLLVALTSGWFTHKKISLVDIGKMVGKL